MPNTPPSSSPSDGDSRFSSADSDVLSYTSSSTMSSSGSPQPQMTTVRPNKKLKREPASAAAPMNDSSRIMVCMFVMSVLFFNPFSLVINQSSDTNTDFNAPINYARNEHLNSRVLNWFDSKDAQHTLNQTSNTFSMFDYYNGLKFKALSWCLNLILVLFCLFKIYSKSEPSYADLSKISNKNSQNLWLLYQKASKSFQKKDYEESFEFFERALNEIGQYAPKTKFQLFFGILWQMTRLVLNKFYIGVLLTRLNIWLNGAERQNTMKIYKLCALFYYEMSKFGYLNLKSSRDFTPIASLKEKNIHNESNLGVNFTFYSYLLSIYYTLAMHNMCDIYTRKEYRKEMSLRDEYDLCEFYLSFCVYLNLFAPSRLSRSLMKFVLKKKLPKTLDLNKFGDDNETNVSCQVKRMKMLLKISLFASFIINFEKLSNNNLYKYGFYDEEMTNERQKILNFLSFKRRLIKRQESFLYNADDSASSFEPMNSNTRISSQNGIATGFLLEKFRDFILLKMLNHVLNTYSSMIKTNRLINSLNHPQNSIIQQQELKEQTEIDVIKFEKLKNLFELANNSNKQGEELNSILIEFLDLLNNWKLRNLQGKKSNMSRKEFKNSTNSLFIESIINVFRAYENILVNNFEKALVYCKKSNENLTSYSNQLNTNSPNHHLIEVNTCFNTNLFHLKIQNKYLF